MKTVFMGTPEFAVPVLEALHKSEKHKIQAVVTVPDQWGGRNQQKRLESAVKKYAMEAGLPILQPKKLNRSDFLKELRDLQPDIIIVVAFKKLPKLVWSIPRFGTINLHASLLPAYRGAAPINHAIIAGETQTGLTTFFINEEIDAGKILLQTTIPIDRKDTAGSLYSKMMNLGGEHVLKTLKGIKDGTLHSVSQEDHKASPAPKVFFDQNEIDFDQSTETLYNFIRGMSPYPAAWTRYEGKILKLYFTEPIIQSHTEKPGTIETNFKEYFHIYTADGYLSVTDLQLEGKRRMEIKDFLNGLKPS